jgi:serine/threonine-protein kinase
MAEPMDTLRDDGGPLGGRDPFIGRVMAGRYRIDAFVGSGAMGRVYRATQRQLDKTVAVKILNTNLLGDGSAQQRFLREAQAASRIDHPNSVAVFDFGHEPDGTVFIVMEYLRGESLGDVLEREGALPAARCVAIMSQVLAALSEAHQHGVVHRDLKPENIMLVARAGDDGCAVKVADFGIAKVLDGDHPGALKITATGIIPGSPAYISPEQAQGRAVDGRSDLYQCGVLLYEMVTGEIPFGGESAVAVLMQHITEPAPSPRARNPRCPPALERLILRAMQKDPALRFADARAMRHALKEVAPDEVVATAEIRSRFSRPTPLVPSAPSPPRADSAPGPAPARAAADARPRHRLLTATVIAATAVCTAAVLITFQPATATTARAYPVVTVRPAAALRRSRGAAPPAVEAPAVVFETRPKEAAAPPPVRAARAAPRAAPRAAVENRVEPVVVTAAAVVENRVEPVVVTAPAVVEAPAPAVVEAPAPVRALTGVDGSLLAVHVTGGLTRASIQGRAGDAVEALARCVFRSGEAMASAVTVTGTVTVVDRRVDEVRLSGAPAVGGCRAAVLGAFSGDLPQAEDVQYDVRLTMRLTPRR